MKILKRALTFITTLSLMCANFAMAQSQDSFQQVADLAAQKIIRLKEQGARIEDEHGREISAAQIVTGKVSTLVYIPNDGKQLKYLYKVNQKTQVTTVAVLTKDGVRIAARSFQVDASLSPEQNVLKMRQTMGSLDAEVDLAIAKTSTSATNRTPASAAGGALVLIVGLGVGICTILCLVRPHVETCGPIIIIPVAVIFLASMA